MRCSTLIVAPRGEAIGNATPYRHMRELIRGSDFVTYDVERHNIADYTEYRCAADAMSFM